MAEATADQELSWFTWGERDCWPFVRILIVGAVLFGAGHSALGLKLDMHRLLRMPGQVLGVLSVMAMISFVLAELYLLLFAIPLYVLGVLNDWFYAIGQWVYRKALGETSSVMLAFVGVCGEVLLFGGLGLLIRRFLHLP